MSTPLLILDLDETLIFGTRAPLSHPPDLDHAGWCIYHRPHLADFIAQVRTAYELAVWTAATESYADLVVGTAFRRISHSPLSGVANAAPGGITPRRARNTG